MRWTLALLLVSCTPKGADVSAPQATLGVAEALDAGAPKRALDALDRAGAAEAGLGLMRVQALVETDEWGEAERRIAKLDPRERPVGDCLLASAREDVRAEKLCRAAGTPEEPAVADAVKRALARALSRDMRLEEAEFLFRELLKARATLANRRALIDFLEKQGFVKEAADELERWLADKPSDVTVAAKLVAVLERKVRGDLLEKRADEALAAGLRILALRPSKAEVRYFLAEAYVLKGDTAAAERERKTAEAVGAKPPPAVDSIPGGEVPAGQGHAHDHGHDHDH